MSKIIAAIPAHYAVDVQPFVSTEEARYYLCGFAIEPSLAGGVNVIATDGHRMGVFQVDEGTAEATQPIIVTLDKATLKACKTTKRGDTIDRWLVINEHYVAFVIRGGPSGDDGEDDYLDAACNPASDRFVALQANVLIDGTFPDWRRVLPNDDGQGTQGAGHGFNAKYLASFGTVSDSSAPIIRVMGKESHPAWVHVQGRDDFVGVIMPATFEGVPLGKPSWLDAPSETEQPIAQAA